MIGLTKNLGDLPNMIYLLSYDASVVGQQLERVLKLDPGQGTEYLQKIIQLPFELDHPQDDRLYALLLASLQKHTNVYGDLESGLSDAWTYVISEFAKTPRDINRLISKFIFLSGSLSEITEPMDLLVLTVADVIEPSLYRWIQSNQSKLNNGGVGFKAIHDIDLGNIVSTEPPKKTSLQKLNEISENKIDLNARHIKLLEFLFPKFSKSKSPLLPKRRPAHHSIENAPHTADYFKLSQSRTTWPRSLLSEFSQRNNYDQNFQDIFDFINQAPEVDRSSLRVRIIDEINDWARNQEFNFYEWLKAVLENAPQFITEKDEIGWEDNFARLNSKLGYELDRKSINKYEIIEEPLLSEHYDFSLPAFLIWKLIGGRNPNSTVSIAATSPIDNTETIRQKFEDRCRKLLASETLFTQADPSRILRAWSSMNVGGLEFKDFEKYITLNKYPSVFFNLNVNRSTAGDYINLSEPGILDHKSIHQMAQRILASDEYSRVDKIAAEIYSERYKNGAKKNETR